MRNSDEAFETQDCDDDGTPLACECCEWLQAELERINQLVHTAETAYVRALMRGRPDETLRIKADKLKNERNAIVQYQLDHQRHSHCYVP